MYHCFNIINNYILSKWRDLKKSENYEKTKRGNTNDLDDYEKTFNS